MNARIAPLRPCPTSRRASPCWAPAPSARQPGRRLASWADTPLDGGCRWCTWRSRSRSATMMAFPPTPQTAVAQRAARQFAGCRGRCLDRRHPHVIDATASPTVANAPCLSRRHPRGDRLQTGAAVPLARWRAVRSAAAPGTRYWRQRHRRCRACRCCAACANCGRRRPHAVAGVLGSLAWLFNHYDGLRPFSNFVRAAPQMPATEPDPRDDLSAGTCAATADPVARAGQRVGGRCGASRFALVPGGAGRAGCGRCRWRAARRWMRRCANAIMPRRTRTAKTALHRAPAGRPTAATVGLGVGGGSSAGRRRRHRQKSPRSGRTVTANSRC